MPATDLRVYKKTEMLLYEIYPVLTRFPKSEKFALSKQIKDHIIELLKNISLGNSVKSKRKTYLQQADGHLQVVKVLNKLSRQRKYISMGFYEKTDVQLTEINKMLSSYIKSS